MPWTIQRRENQWCVYKEGRDGEPEGDALGCHPTLDEARAQLAALEINVKELGARFQDVLIVQEFFGKFPEVPTAPGVDVAALTADDPNPMFLVLPIGKANVTSVNGRFYDDAFVQELERQVLTMKPIGLMGHLSDDERSTAFPPEAVHWIGAVRVGDTLWGKAYVVPGPARDRIRRYRAQGKTLATSIDAAAKGAWDERRRAVRMLAESLRLNQIDLAPAERAGIPDLAAVPVLTTEMGSVQVNGQFDQQEDEVDRTQVIREMTPEDAKILPDQVKAAVLASAPEVQQLVEIRQILGVSPDANLVQSVKELRLQQDSYVRERAVERVRELARDPHVGIKVEPVRDLVVELVMAKQPKTVEDAEKAYQQVIESESVKRALSMTVQEMMGPPGTNPAQKSSGRFKYFDLPQEE